MKLRSIKSIATFVLVLSAMPAAQAYDFTIGGVYYNYTADRKGAIVTYSDINNNAYTGDVNIPARVAYGMNTMTVKGIDDHAFFNCQTLKSVTLHEGITYIGSQAFSHCYAMTSITLPQSLQRIEDYAFEYCEDMTSFQIPASVTLIGYSVFYKCLGITAFDVDEDNIQFTSADGVLYLKDKSILIQYPAAKTDSEYMIPEEVKTVTDYAFTPAPYLKKITIGSGVGKIEPLTFGECYALDRFEVSPDNAAICSVDGVLFDKNVTQLLQYPVGRDADEYALPETATSMADMSMAGCKRLTSLTLPASFAGIGEYALSECSGLARVFSLNPVPPSTVVSPINPTGAIFDASVYRQATLYVGKDAIETYRKDPEWGKFARILDIDEAGCEDAYIANDRITVDGHTISTADHSAMDVYDIYGRLICTGTGCVDIPESGVYMVVTPSCSIKILIR